MATVSKSAKFKRVDAYDEDGNRQVFHIYDPKRVTQTRGVSAMAPIFDCLGMFEDINFAKLVQQQIVSCFAIFKERDATWSGPQGAPLGATSTQTRSDGSVSTLEGISPGLMISGAPGEKLQGFSPNVPNSEFFQHVKLILTLCSINLGLPLCLALLDASETNFSGFRGALDQAKIRWKANQKNLKTQFHTPVYKWKLRQWMSEDDNFRARMERKNVMPFAHVWNVPSWPYIEPNKDAQADIARLKGGLTSPRRLHAERGCDSDQIARESVADNAYAIREAKREAAAIKSEFDDGNPVHWRELISLPLPDGFTVSTSTANEPTQQQGGGDGVPA
jgi:capsid protein